jgi:hypothetical protein
MIRVAVYTRSVNAVFPTGARLFRPYPDFLYGFNFYRSATPPSGPDGHFASNGHENPEIPAEIARRNRRFRRVASHVGFLP